MAIRVRSNSEAGPAAGQASICVRPHNLTLTADNAEAQALANQGYNLFVGIIDRRIYFGESADYTVDCAPYPFRLRVVGPPSRLYDKGQKIFAAALPEHCVLVSDR